MQYAYILLYFKDRISDETQSSLDYSLGKYVRR